MKENLSAEAHTDITRAVFKTLKDGDLNNFQSIVRRASHAVELSNLRDRLGRTLLEYIIAKHDLGALEILYARDCRPTFDFKPYTSSDLTNLAQSRISSTLLACITPSC